MKSSHTKVFNSLLASFQGDAAFSLAVPTGKCLYSLRFMREKGWERKGKTKKKKIRTAFLTGKEKERKETKRKLYPN